MKQHKLEIHQYTMRHGKTRKDRSRGVWDNRFNNRDLRVSWQHGHLNKFPIESCNGKRNRQK